MTPPSGSGLSPQLAPFSLQDPMPSARPKQALMEDAASGVPPSQGWVDQHARDSHCDCQHPFLLPPSPPLAFSVDRRYFFLILYKLSVGRLNFQLKWSFERDEIGLHCRPPNAVGFKWSFPAKSDLAFWKAFRAASSLLVFAGDPAALKIDPVNWTVVLSNCPTSTTHRALPTELWSQQCKLLTDRQFGTFYWLLCAAKYPPKLKNSVEKVNGIQHEVHCFFFKFLTFSSESSETKWKDVPNFVSLI